jgi:preprotein translocase subunit SecF
MHFINQRKIFYTISSVAILSSLVVFVFAPKNFGIDMTGGLQIEYSTNEIPNEAKLAEVKEQIIETYTFEDKKVLSDVNVYPVNNKSIRADIGLNIESDKEKSALRTADIRAKIPGIFAQHEIEVTEASFISVGQSFGKFVIDRAYLTLLICCIGIALYVMFAFRKSIEGVSSAVF